MKKLSLFVLCMAMLAAMLVTSVSAAVTHTVAAGDTMWKIAVKYEVGLDELKATNPQITNAALIYPGQVLQIPQADVGVTAYVQQVVRLVNEICAQNGLNALTYDWELSRVAQYKSQDMKDNRYFRTPVRFTARPFR